MADDRATDIVHELDEDERARLIPLLGTDARQAIQKLLSYPPNTAGALMTTEYVAVPASWTVAQTLQHIRQVERTVKRCTRSTCWTRPASSCSRW
jgi:magnesium transporter